MTPQSQQTKPQRLQNLRHLMDLQTTHLIKLEALSPKSSTPSCSWPVKKEQMVCPRLSRKLVTHSVLYWYWQSLISPGTCCPMPKSKPSKLKIKEICINGGSITTWRCLLCGRWTQPPTRRQQRPNTAAYAWRNVWYCSMSGRKAKPNSPKLLNSRDGLHGTCDCFYSSMPMPLGITGVLADED